MTPSDLTPPDPTSEPGPATDPDPATARTPPDPSPPDRVTGRTDRDGEASDGGAEPAVSPTSAQCVDFEQLARGQRVVLVLYRGQQYRLTATRTGKLVLNK